MQCSCVSSFGSFYCIIIIISFFHINFSHIVSFSFYTGTVLSTLISVLIPPELKEGLRLALCVAIHLPYVFFLQS